MKVAFPLPSSSHPIFSLEVTTANRLGFIFSALLVNIYVYACILKSLFTYLYTLEHNEIKL